MKVQYSYTLTQKEQLLLCFTIVLRKDNITQGVFC